jgi:catechol 2,3-dioxygenase-like lactoylglutathione lyase family enzyme
MIDHISVGVSDLERSARFYEPTLATLGLTRLVTRPATIGFGKSYPEFWINLRKAMARVEEGSGTHICLRARSTDEVDAFHAAALHAGGRSMAPLACGRMIACVIMQPLSPIPTAIASRR